MKQPNNSTFLKGLTLYLTLSSIIIVVMLVVVFLIVKVKS